MMNLKDLLPPGVNCEDDSSLLTTFRATRLEFIILVCEDDGEDLDDDELDWEIPDQDTFDEAVGMAVEAFTAKDPDRITHLSWSSTGWDTGVGMVALTTTNLQMVKEFRDALITLDLDGQRVMAMPKQILLKKYAMTIYFGRPFHRFTLARLMYWLGLCNDLKGEMDIIEARYFAKDHPNPRRRGARIIAFEGNQAFMDSLQKFPKDFPFSVRFGGNLYIRGGDRYLPLLTLNYMKLTCKYLLQTHTHTEIERHTLYLPFQPYPTLTLQLSLSKSCLLYTSPSPRDS